MDTFTASLSTFQVFLGLKKDLVNKVSIKDTEIFYEIDYDIEANYKAVLNADIEDQGFGLTLYDNLYKGYSPEGKNTLNILNLQGYSHWEKYESDYFQGKKKASSIVAVIKKAKASPSCGKVPGKLPLWQNNRRR